MRKTIAAVLAGLAFVAGGFFAGTWADTDTAIAQTEAPAEAEAFAPPVEGRRGPARHMLEAAAEYLEMDPVEVREYLVDGGVLADLTDDVDGLINAIVEAATEDIDQAVEDGKLDPERAAEIKEQLPERVETFVTTPHERPDRVRADRHVRGFVKEAADIIGIDVSELVEGLEAGKSIVEVAEENGMSEGNLVAHLTNSARERIEEAVNRTK